MLFITNPIQQIIPGDFTFYIKNLKPQKNIGKTICRRIFSMLTGIHFIFLLQRQKFALHTTGFEKRHLSNKNLSHFRKLCYDYYNKTGIDFIQNCIFFLPKKITGV